MITGFTYDYCKDDDTFLIIDRDIPISDMELDYIQVKMFKSTTIPNMISMDIEEMNCKVKLRYNITSKQILYHFKKSNKLDMKDLYNILFQIVCILDD